jgi:DNA-binding NtrC family response regulator
MKNLLCVGYDPEGVRTLASLVAGTYRVTGCEDELGLREGLRRLAPAVVIVNLGVEGKDRLPLLGSLAHQGVPAIAMSAAADARTIVRAVKSGAADFLGGTCPPAELRRAIAMLCEGASDGAGILNTRHSRLFSGKSPAIKRVAARIRLFARADFPVLILGESGTGKELAARALHELSSRQGGSFIARNCAALPEHLAESELFGTERGAFTDAVARPGAFELARGGVLFLDEIGEARLGIQAKLLRVLETRELWRLGGSKPVEVDVRLVSATAMDLGAAVANKTFRQDLFYRIDTLVLRLPPLRERKEDIPDLAAHFSLAASGGRTVPGAAALAKLASHDWPGNVRQLRNVIHRALVLAGGIEELGEEHIEF